MRRFFAFFLIITTLFTFVSCGESRSAKDMLSEFIAAYGAEGIIYHSGADEMDDGYIEYDLLKKIYVFYGDFPEDFAIFLNSHSDYGSECGVFICDGKAESEAEEMCLERIRLLGGDDEAFVIREGDAVFYSVMSDGERARELWRRVAK